MLCFYYFYKKISKPKIYGPVKAIETGEVP